MGTTQNNNLDILKDSRVFKLIEEKNMKNPVIKKIN